MSSTNQSSTSTTSTTTTPNTETITLILQRPPERVRRNQHIVDGTLHVDWTNDVVDNENMNKKKSKKCCIFRKPKDYDESSDESSWEDPDPSDDEKD